MLLLITCIYVYVYGDMGRKKSFNFSYVCLLMLRLTLQPCALVGAEVARINQCLALGTDRLSASKYHHWYTPLDTLFLTRTAQFSSYSTIIKNWRFSDGVAIPVKEAARLAHPISFRKQQNFQTAFEKPDRLVHLANRFKPNVYPEYTAHV